MASRQFEIMRSLYELYRGGSVDTQLINSLWREWERLERENA